MLELIGGAKAMARDTLNPARKNEGQDTCQDASCCPPKNPYLREIPKVGRNEPCPCGNGKKFKNAVAGAFKEPSLVNRLP